jgi:RsiW-degrading membrane proteinase PrsW (M82 family)
MFGTMSLIDQGKVTIPFHRPSLEEKLFFFFSGIIVSIPFATVFESLATVLSPSLTEPYAAILAVAIIAPLVEEFGKAYPLYYRHGETKKSIMNLGFLVGLGFGITELLEYVVILDVPVLARLPGVLFHAANTSTVAYGIANKKPIQFYLIAVAFHFLFNMAAMFDPSQILIYLSFLLTVYLFWYLYSKTPETLIPY